MTKTTGKIWQTADNIGEAIEWANKYLVMGALHVELKPRKPMDNGPRSADDYLVDVIVTLVRTPETELNMILGYKIEAEEWMTEDYAVGKHVFVSYDDGVIKAGTVRGRRTTEMQSGSTTTEYCIQYVGEDTQTYWVREDDVTDDAVEAAQRLHAECTGG